MGSDDRRLVERFLRKRDDGSFSALYRAHTPALYRTAWRLLGPARQSEAEDVVQETWVRAAERLAAFEWRSALRTWLTAILINCARESSRRARREPPPGPQSTSEPRELGIALDDAIGRLPPRARSVLTLHDIEGFTHHEIGELLDISAGTSKSHLFDARRRLREILGGSS